MSHSFSSERSIINYNSDLSGDVRIYDKTFNREVTIPGKDLVDLVLGTSLDRILAVTNELNDRVKEVKKYRGFCGHCMDQPCTCNDASLSQRIMKRESYGTHLKELLVLLDEDLFITIYLGDTACDSLVYEDNPHRKPVPENYHDHKIDRVDLVDGKIEILLDI